jgi:predicted MFS family arabinose efflux permease
MGLFMRQELGLADGAIVSILLMGSVLTNVAVNRVSGWLDSIPSVQVQVGAGAVRTALFVCYALLALVAGAGWTVVVLIPLFALSQLTWGAIVPANTRRFADLAPPSRRGEVAALQSASIGLGVVLGAALGGMVAESVGFSAMFALSGALALAGTLLLLRW